MAIFSVFIVNKAGGLIYQYDHNTTRPEVEKTFSYPLDVVLKIYNERLVVVFGERDGIKGIGAYTHLLRFRVSHLNTVMSVDHVGGPSKFLWLLVLIMSAKPKE